MPTTNIDDGIWGKLGLKADPFPLTPTPASEFVWAGQAQLKSELDAILQEAAVAETTQFIGLVAPWGAGKTHALGYYSHADNRPKTEVKAFKEMRFVPVTFPKSEKQIAEGFFHRVLDKMTWEHAVNLVTQFGAQHGDTFKKHMGVLLQDNADLMRAFDYLRQGDLDEATSFVVKSYLFGQATKRDRDRLRLIRPGNSVEERYLALNALFALESGWQSAERTRIVLWIDEAENLIKLSSTYFDPFTQGLRDVLDMARKVYGCLTVVINFTPESKNFEGEMYAILGNALYDRLDKRIQIAPMSAQDGVAFIKDALRGYSADPAKPQLVFTDPALTFIATLLEDAMTPRRINRVGSAIMHTVLTEDDALQKFPISDAKIKELIASERLKGALVSERPGN